MCTPPVRGSHGLAAEVEHPLLDRSHCKSVDGLEQAASFSVHVVPMWLSPHTSIFDVLPALWSFALKSTAAW